jgi:signal transduction histidine kinase
MEVSEPLRVLPRSFAQAQAELKAPPAKPVRRRAGSVCGPAALDHHPATTVADPLLHNLLSAAHGSVGESRARPSAALEIGIQIQQALSDATGAEMALLDEHGVIVSTNAAWSRLLTTLNLGSRLHGVGASYVEACGRMAPELDKAALRRAFVDLAKGRISTIDYAWALGDGEDWRQVRITPLRVGASIGFMAVHEDLTEVARAQAALRRANEQLLSVQEEERQRIAIELHDSTSQHLVAAALGVERLRRIGSGRGMDAVLDDMAISIQQAVKEIRILSFAMKPPGLEQGGLESTVRSYVKGFGVRTGLKVDFTCDGAVETASTSVRHAVYRLVQEALSNVHRHAEATAARVALRVRGGVLMVSVTDDGKGIAALRRGDPAGAPDGVGIASMQTRVSQLHGVFEISCGTVGTAVTARLPLEDPGAGPGPLRHAG